MLPVFIEVENLDRMRCFDLYYVGTYLPKMTTIITAVSKIIPTLSERTHDVCCENGCQVHYR